MRRKDAPTTDWAFPEKNIDHNKIIFPSFSPSDCNNLEQNIANFLEVYFDKITIEAYIERLSLIGVNNYMISLSNNTLNIIYGLVIPKIDISNDIATWKLFSFMDSNIPNDLAIIGATIKYGF